LLFGLALLAFVALAVLLLFGRPLVALDQWLSAAVRSVAVPWLDAIARPLTFIGSVTGMTVLTALVAGWYLLRRRRSEAIFLALTVGLGTLVGNVLKPLIGRVRPDVEFARVAQPDPYSFPSGHALASFLFFGALVFLVMTAEEDLSLRAKSVISAVLITVGLSVSISRVYLGVHYVGDVIGAWLLGSATLIVGVAALLAATEGTPHD
jgi:undecaprenyl-diphosphatase